VLTATPNLFEAVYAHDTSELRTVLPVVGFYARGGYLPYAVVLDGTTGHLVSAREHRPDNKILVVIRAVAALEVVGPENSDA
jgi:hypothetical protein